MGKYLLVFLALCLFPLYEARADFVTIANCDSIPTAQRLTNGTFCLQTTTAGGRNAGTSWVWSGTAWVAQAGGGGGHVIEDEGTPLSQRSNLNVTGSGGAATDAGGKTVLTIPGITVQDEGTPLSPYADIFNCTGSGIVCTSAGGKIVFNVPGGAVSLSDPYVWTGTHSWRDGNFSILNSADTTKVLKFDLAGFTTGTTRVWSGPNATTRLWGDSDFSGNGIMVRTGSGTGAARTIGGTAGNIVVANGDGVLGPPVIDLGTTAVQTDQANTYGNFDQNFAGAASFTVPTATNAAPTGPGRIAFDSVANRPKYGNGTSSFTFANTLEIQPLNTNLTQLGGLTGVANSAFIHTGSAWTLATLPPCSAAGQTLQFDATLHTYSCVTVSASGLSGTANKLVKFGSATTGVDSIISESGTVATIAGSLVVGTGIGVVIDSSAVTTSDKTWTAMNQSGTVRLSTGAFTSGNIVKTDANGLLVDGGAAGTGTWTDSSTNTGTNKTLDESSNTIKITKSVQVELFAPTTDNATGTGLYYFRVPVSLNGTALTTSPLGVQANVVTAGTGGTVAVQVTKCTAVATTPLCSGTTVNMLSTAVSIDAGETSSTTAATAAVVNTTASANVVSTGQILQFTVLNIHSTTPAKGLFVNLDFKLP